MRTIRIRKTERGNSMTLMEMFSRKETAKILGISLKTLDALREDKRIGYYQMRPGCKVQFTQAQIDKYLRKSERGMKTP